MRLQEVEALVIEGVLAAALLASIGLNVVLGVGALSGWKAALARADAKGDATTRVAEVEGEEKLDAKKVEDANAATTTALDAEHKQEHRGDNLEKDLVHEEARPHGGLAGLSNLPTAEAVPDPSAGTDPRSSNR